MTTGYSEISSEARSKLGTIGKLDDGRTHVRFERLLPHSIENVWSAITQPAHLEKWFPGIRIDLKVGGTFTINFGGDCDGPAHVEGTVIRLDPPNLLQMGSMRWKLEAKGASCLLTFTDILHDQDPADRTKAELSNSVLGGWHGYLDILEDHLAGRELVHDKPEFDYSKLNVPGRD